MRRLVRAGNRIGVWLYRTLDGRLASARRRDTVLAQAPEVARYARKAGRAIPVAVLHPLDQARG
jgi:hypothetical protein